MAGSQNGDGGEDGEGGGWLQNCKNGGWLQNGDGQKIILVSLKVGHFCRRVWSLDLHFKKSQGKLSVKIKSSSAAAEGLKGLFGAGKETGVISSCLVQIEVGKVIRSWRSLKLLLLFQQ